MQYQQLEAQDRQLYNFDLGVFVDGPFRKQFVKRLYGYLALCLTVFRRSIKLSLLFVVLAFHLKEFGGILAVTTVGELSESAKHYYEETPYNELGCIILNTCISLAIQPEPLFWISLGIVLLLHFICLGMSSFIGRAPFIQYIVFIPYLIFMSFFLAGLGEIVALYFGTIVIVYSLVVILTIVVGLLLHIETSKLDITIPAVAPIIVLLSTITFVVVVLFYYQVWIFLLPCAIIVSLYGFYVVWQTEIILGLGIIKYGKNDQILALLTLYGAVFQLLFSLIECVVIRTQI